MTTQVVNLAPDPSEAPYEGRELAALLCRELTGTSLAQLSIAFGLGHPDSSANLVKKAKRIISDQMHIKKNYTMILPTA